MFLRTGLAPISDESAHNKSKKQKILDISQQTLLTNTLIKTNDNLRKLRSHLSKEIKNKTQVHFSERDNEVIEMIKDNLDDEKIIKYTKISKERLEELRKISQ